MKKCIEEGKKDSFTLFLSPLPQPGQPSVERHPHCGGRRVQCDPHFTTDPSTRPASVISGARHPWTLPPGSARDYFLRSLACHNPGKPHGVIFQAGYCGPKSTLAPVWPAGSQAGSYGQRLPVPCSAKLATVTPDFRLAPQDFDFRSAAPVPSSRLTPTLDQSLGPQALGPPQCQSYPQSPTLQQNQGSSLFHWTKPISMDLSGGLIQCKANFCRFKLKTHSSTRPAPASPGTRLAAVDLSARPAHLPTQATDSPTREFQQ